MAGSDYECKYAPSGVTKHVYIGILARNFIMFLVLLSTIVVLQACSGKRPQLHAVERLRR